MATDPRDALNRLIAAFEHHFDIAQAGDRVDARTMEAAEDLLRDAFFTYDDQLFTRYGVELPFDLVEDDDLEDEELDEDADDVQDVDEEDLDDPDIDDTEIDDIEAD
ncbi:DNA primase [Schaalia naturae]|uniref:DNA primase n=1 Tax=Schaalia naturae TaxID=635203 RepID=A0ABW2SL24_9ACTO